MQTLEPNPTPATPQKSFRFSWPVAILCLGLAGAIGTAITQHSNAVSLKMEINGLQKEISGLRQTVQSTDQQVEQKLTAIRSEFDATKKEVTDDAQKLKADARRLVDAQARRHAQAMATKLTKQQEEAQEKLTQVSQKLDEIKTSAESQQMKLTDVTNDVTDVKKEVAGTRSDLERTIGELRRATGDLGVLSGLIATNAKELSALKQLGERDYFEFTLTKRDKVHKLGDMQLTLKKADPKRNRYSVEILADDKKVEKKDKTVNEPVQFYVVSKARQPLELVVNEVKKDTIVGYVSVPKARAVTTSARM